MNNRYLNLALLLLVLPLVGAALGALAGPWLARTHHVTQVAERIWLEETQGLEERTLQSEAFRANNLPMEQLYQDALAIRRSFRWGGALFGLFCGLVAALKIATILLEPRRREYEADRAHCLACGRCYLSCPVEHQRLEERAS